MTILSKPPIKSKQNVTINSSDCIQGRIFLVGCPRSGTTLLQSMLAAHPQIMSFPETHFLVATGKTRRGRWLTRLGLASPEMKSQLQRFLNDIGRTELYTRSPKYSIWIKPYATSLSNILDFLTLEQKKNIWLEKTPGHLHYIKHWERYIPNAKFIHIIRNGTDVIASLYEVTHQYPAAWGSVYNIDKCIARWNKDIQRTRHYSDKRNHFIVRYEQLVQSPQIILTNICHFLGVPFNQNMLTKREHTIRHIVLSSEVWKQRTEQKLTRPKIKKFERVFDEKQQAYIKKHLINI